MSTRWRRVHYMRLTVYSIVIVFGVTTFWLHEGALAVASFVNDQVLASPPRSAKTVLPSPGLHNDTTFPMSTHPAATQPVRILLGIASPLNGNEDRQRRHLNRKTYLDFDRLHRPDQPNRVCSLQEYFSAPKSYQACQLIYTFVLNPEEPFGSKEPLTVVPADLFGGNLHERDVIYINVGDNDHVGKRWGWFRYASSLVNGTGISLVAYTDCHVMVKPTTFWDENPIFGVASSLQGIYGGWLNHKESCLKKKCPSLLRDTVMRRFVLLSSDLAHYVASQTIPTLTSNDSPDVAIANALDSYPYQIRELNLQGLDTSTTPTVGAYLKSWDKFKDNLVYNDVFLNYTDPVEQALVLSKHPSLLKKSQNRNARVLLGIFTMNSPTELERREMIRRTYLRAFVDSDKPRRICSLNELETIELEKRDDCEIAYTFVVGANINDRKELVEVTDASGPIYLQGELLPRSVHLVDHQKGDIVYLNIQENMKEGKSQTYLKFATIMLDEYYFDYVAKTDTDTLVYPSALLKNVIYKLPKFPDNVRIYAGEYRIQPSTPVLQLGPAYMGGHFYLMSPDLARYVTSPACNRSALAVYSEDTSMGNFIHSHPKPIRRIWMQFPPFLHPIKRVDRLRTLWNERVGKNKN